MKFHNRLYGKYLENVADFLLSLFSDDEKICLGDILNNIPIASGKMVRSSALFSFSCIHNKSTVPEDYSILIELGSAVEILHMATLVHDDVIDNASVRRNAHTVNSVFGNRIAILSGDLLFAKAFSIISNIKSEKSQKISQIFSKATEKLVFGEMSEEIMIFDDNFTIEQYIEIISNKTAALFVAACEVGSLIACGKYDESVTKISENIGKAFQIRDDLLDYFGNDTGKSKFADLKEKKVTLPILVLKKYTNKDESKFIKNIFDIHYNIEEKDIDYMLKILDKYKIKEKILEYIDFYLDIAKVELDSFSKSDSCGEMRYIIDEIANF